MFTGIIESLGKVINVKVDRGNIDFTIESKISNELKIDQSVSHNGVCLTVTDKSNNTHTVTAVKETLDKSSLTNFSVNDLINLERAMRLGERLDGHLVQGHVEGVGRIIKIENIGTEEVRFSIHLDSKLIKYCIYKGSISIDGISLTIAYILDDIIEVAIIPHTLKHTNLSFKKVNDRVNIETDMISKYVENIAGFKGA